MYIKVINRNHATSIMLSLTLVYTTKYIGDGDDVILEKKKIIILEPPIKNSIYNVKLLYNISYQKEKQQYDITAQNIIY